MRAYAFSGRNRWVLIPLATCYLGLLAVNVWVFCIRIEAIPASFYILIGGTGCFPNYGDQVMAEKIGVSIFLKLNGSKAYPVSTVVYGSSSVQLKSILNYQHIFTVSCHIDGLDISCFCFYCECFSSQCALSNLTLFVAMSEIAKQGGLPCTVLHQPR